MISDSIPNASVSMASSNPKDFPKKKRAHRSAKLKQCKRDARREQWLSQVKNKAGCKEEANGRGGLCREPSLVLERGQPVEKLEIKARAEEEIYGHGSMLHNYSDIDSSPSNSPTSRTSSILGSNVSGVTFTASSRSGSSSGRSSSSNDCCSGSMSEAEEADDGDDGCLADWEALADEDAPSDSKQQEHGGEQGISSPPSENHGVSAQSGPLLGVMNKPYARAAGADFSNGNSESAETVLPRAAVNRHAWQPNDAFRPQSLPNLSKQYSFPSNYGRGESVWGCKSVGPVPTSCPICFEDFDCTDSSFLPCPCGFRLCLFCHKRILEENGRCPSCRKKYEHEPVEGEATLDGGSLTFRLARSCSMITRS